MIKERPILFNAAMVNALLALIKINTRRMKGLDEVNKNPEEWKFSHLAICHFKEDKNFGKYGAWFKCVGDQDFEYTFVPCPYGTIGERLWVKETHSFDSQLDGLKAKELSHYEPVYYHADDVIRTMACSMISKGKTRPSIFMTRWASRILLEITDVRVERLNDISESDAAAEGLEVFNEDGNLWYSGWFDGQESWFTDQHKWHCNSPVDAFKELWDGINFSRGLGWNENPWVWVVEFKVIEK